MPTRNVVITDHQAALVDRLVATGRYQNASEVLRAGLRAIEQREATYEAKIAALRAAVQVGIDDIEAGRFTSFENFDELDAYLADLTAETIQRADTGGPKTHADRR